MRLIWNVKVNNTLAQVFLLRCIFFKIESVAKCISKFWCTAELYISTKKVSHILKVLLILSTAIWFFVFLEVKLEICTIPKF